MTDTSNGNPEKPNSDRKTFSGKLFNEVDHFVNEDGNYIFCRHWEPSNSPEKLLMIAHGYAEHCGRHERMAEMLKEMGFHVFSHDHYGHGESDGRKVDVTDYRIYLRDMLQHVNIMKQRYPGLPVYLYGHSMGGALTMLLAHENPSLFQCVVLSAPMISKSAEFSSTWKVYLAEKLSSLMPHVGIAALDANTISRNPDEVERYKNDKLNYTGKVLLRMACQLYNIQNAATNSLPDINFPFLVIHGSGDKLCSVEGSKMLHQLAKSTDKTIKIYEGGYHELIHDTEGYDQRLLDDVKQWLNERNTQTS